MKTKLIITGLAVLAVLTAASTRANTIDFTTPAGTSSSDGPLSAEAVLTAGSGQVTITLTDLLANPTSAGQLISGVVFDITGATGLGTVSGSGKLATIAANGSYTTPVSASSLTHWADTMSGSTFTLTTLSGSQPNQMIIGPDNGSGKFSNANASIINFNPTVLGSASFTLSIPGVTSASTISNVRIEFGTGPDTVVGTPPTVPDGGSTVALLGMALCGFGLVGRNFRKS